MSTQQRRARLKRILEVVVAQQEFTRVEVGERCAEELPGYVTRTLKQLVAEGILQQHGPAKMPKFFWAVDRQNFQPDRWIDQQLHQDQVRELPTQQRPREKLLHQGAGALTTGELLAILIRVGIRGESAITGGQKLANRLEPQLERLPRLSLPEIRDFTKAVTKANYCQIMAGVELGRRVADAEAQRPVEKPRITSTAAAVAYCADAFRHLARDGVQEEFHVVTLDTKHKPIQNHRITVGTLDASLVHPREVFRAAFRDAASALLLVHNHPSGDPTPSREDHQVTKRLTEVGELMGIRVLDHIIVASEACLSLREAS